MNFLPFIFILFALVPSAFGQTVDGKQVTRMELVTDADDFTRPFTVGIRFVLEPDWSLYWKNPGDSGLPIEVKWDLPKGWSASEVRHPVPSKFVYDNLVSYGYKKEVVLLVTITPGNEPLNVLKANLDWLVCEESCVRGKADVSLQLDNGSNTQWKAILTDALNKLPGSFKDLSLSPGEARIRKAENGWKAEIDLSGNDAASITDFYPELSDEIFIDLNSIQVNNGVLRFRFDRQAPASDAVQVRGLFVIGDRGYEVSIPIRFTSM